MVPPLLVYMHNLINPLKPSHFYEIASPDNVGTNTIQPTCYVQPTAQKSIPYTASTRFHLPRALLRRQYVCTPLSHRFFYVRTVSSFKKVYATIDISAIAFTNFYKIHCTLLTSHISRDMIIGMDVWRDDG